MTACIYSKGKGGNNAVAEKTFGPGFMGAQPQLMKKEHPWGKKSGPVFGSWSAEVFFCVKS